jgi:hypothetical protein
MDLFAQEKEYNRDSPAKYYTIGDEESFSIAYIDDKHECIEEGRREKIKDWAKTKVTSLTGGDRRESKLYQPIIDKYEIRVLEIKPGKVSDQLKGALHHCSVEFDIELNVNLKGPGQRHALWMKDLTVPITYTALSYTWGEPKFDAKFECDGYVKMITKSLESALRHFRQEDRAVVMWVDQICIDQGNKEEKAQQVPLMSQIYENAINTAIWLGDADDDSDTALRLLEDARICLQFFTEKQFDPNEVARMGLPELDADGWEALWKLLSRRWFERLWIIQEVALSKDLWVVCGNSAIKWESLAAACISLADIGISQWLTDKYSTGVVASDGGDDMCKKAYHLETIRLRLRGQMQKPELLTLMVGSRRAQSMDARDKVYGMLGICDPRTRTGVRVDYSDKYHVAQLYQDVSEYHITEDIPHNRTTLDGVLSPVDHDSVDLPSWVADWRRPRRTMALGSSVYSYQADGRFTPRSLVDATVAKIDSSNPAWKGLQVAGLLFDTLETLSGVFENPDISPTAENKTLKMMLDFVVNLKDYPSPNTDFTAFWQTLVAGKDERRSLTCPDSFAEIFSYILDETTGKKYSISGQAYTPRQKLPKGRGGLHEDKLRSRKPNSAGVTFQQVRTAMINATKNRRLGATMNGYIGLFPEHSQTGDGIFVLSGCQAPFVLRTRGDKKFKLVGQCYVHGIMGGEAVGPNPGLQDIVLS